MLYRSRTIEGYATNEGFIKTSDGGYYGDLSYAVEADGVRFSYSGGQYHLLGANYISWEPRENIFNSESWTHPENQLPKITGLPIPGSGSMNAPAVITTVGYATSNIAYLVTENLTSNTQVAKDFGGTFMTKGVTITRSTTSGSVVPMFRNLSSTGRAIGFTIHSTASITGVLSTNLSAGFVRSVTRTGSVSYETTAIGGLFHTIDGGKAMWCSNEADITTTGNCYTYGGYDRHAGGIAAYLSSGSIISCYNYGNVIAYGDGGGGASNGHGGWNGRPNGTQGFSNSVTTTGGYSGATGYAGGFVAKMSGGTISAGTNDANIYAIGGGGGGSGRHSQAGNGGHGYAGGIAGHQNGGNISGVNVDGIIRAAGGGGGGGGAIFDQGSGWDSNHNWVKGGDGGNAYAYAISYPAGGSRSGSDDATEYAWAGGGGGGGGDGNNNRHDWSQLGGNGGTGAGGGGGGGGFDGNGGDEGGTGGGGGCLGRGGDGGTGDPNAPTGGSSSNGRSRSDGGYGGSGGTLDFTLGYPYYQHGGGGGRPYDNANGGTTGHPGNVGSGGYAYIG